MKAIQKFHINSLRCKCFVLFLSLGFSLSSFTAAVATVKSAKAVIYADIDLKSPIGFVRRGKELAVGEVKRRRGEVLPVVIEQRVAWIKVKDIRLPNEELSFEKDRRITEHNVVLEDDSRDSLKENNFVTFRTGPSTLIMSGESNTSDTIEDFEEEFDSASEISLMFEHKNPQNWFHWGIGLDYFSGELETFRYKTLNVKGGISFVPIRFSLVSFELYGNILVSGDFRVVVASDREYKGSMFGLDYGAAVRLFPEYQFGLIAGIGQTYYSIINLSEVETSDTQSFSFSQVTGSKVFAGLTYKF